jgi:hypothetical protein
MSLQQSPATNRTCFQSLPLEVRHEIYSQLIPSEIREASLTAVSDKNTSFGPLLRTCKKIKNEIETWFDVPSNSHLVKSPLYGLVDPDMTIFTLIVDEQAHPDMNTLDRSSCCADLAMVDHNRFGDPIDSDRLDHEQALFPHRETPWCWRKITSEATLVRDIRICITLTESTRDVARQGGLGHGYYPGWDGYLGLLDFLPNLKFVDVVLGNSIPVGIKYGDERVRPLAHDPVFSQIHSILEKYHRHGFRFGRRRDNETLNSPVIDLWNGYEAFGAVGLICYWG